MFFCEVSCRFARRAVNLSCAVEHLSRANGPMPKICLMCGASFPDATTFCPTDGSALRAAVQGDDLIGELVAERYLITDLLSQGGMGAVYLASDVRLPQQFAIKVLKQQSAPDPSLIARFRQEAEAVCRINHDRVARVFDFGFMADDRAYIVMEYVAGRTLKDVLELRGSVDARETAKIIGMIAEGVDAAHRLGIVHRDLKPENVMVLDDPGGGMRVKVLDFGIAKLQNTEAEQGHTQPGFVIGTPAWMSPEQLLGDTLDARSDVYALGLIAFALLTGQHAFTGPSEQAEMMARISVPPRTLGEVRPDVTWTASLLHLFERTLSRTASDRPATAGQFAAAMMQALPRVVTPFAATQAVTQGPPSAGAGPVRAAASVAPAATAGRPRIGVMVSALAAGAAVIFAVFAWQRNTTPVGPVSGTSDTTVSGSPSSVPTAVTDTLPPAAESTNVARDTIANPAAANSNLAPNAVPPVSRTSSTAPSPTRGGSAEPLAGSGAPSQRPLPSADNTSAAAPALNNAELKKVMDDFDRDDSPRKARETVILIDVLMGRLRNQTEQGWAHNYLGKAHLSLGDKDKACAAFDRAKALATESKRLREDSDEFRLVAACAP
jgi:eukaryotic-like serine/threonine-protein kinase